MQLAIIDVNPATRAALSGRVQEAIRQAEIRKVEVIDVDTARLESFDGSLMIGVLVGPGCFDQVEDIVEKVRINFPTALMGVVLEAEIYANEGVVLRKKLNAHVMPLADMAQLASFIIDCEERAVTGMSSAGNKGVIGVAQLKGGVGATSIVSALASCWARNGLTVAAVDLDDVNPQLTAWGRVGVAQRAVCADLLRQGEVPINRLNEMLNPVEGYEGRLVVAGQPEQYQDGFHFKADVLDGCPSSAEFINSLMSILKTEFDTVIVDLGRSWGISTFATLPHCQQILLVTDDDGMSVRRSLDGLQRLKREAEDLSELNLDKWSLVLNAYSGRLISPRDLAAEIRDMELFPNEAALFTIPFSERGRQWGGPGQSFYDAADEKTRFIIQKIAYTLVPFRVEQQAPMMDKLVKKWRQITNSA